MEEVFEQIVYTNTLISQHFGGPDPDIAETRISERLGTAFWSYPYRNLAHVEVVVPLPLPLPLPQVLKMLCFGEVLGHRVYTLGLQNGAILGDPPPKNYTLV